MPPTVPSAALSHAAHTELDALLHEAVKRRDLPGVVAVVANRDTILYRGAAGTSFTDIFRIASMSKPVTSVAIMMLRERGLLDLDDPVEHYLPRYAGREVITKFNAADNSYTTRPASGPITLRHLLTHTAGFGYDFCNDIVLALTEDGKHSPANLPLLNDPGSRWTYGCATAILGDVITYVTGAPFHHFFDSQILQPLGMAETSYFIAPAAMPRFVPLHFRQGRDWMRDPSTRPHEPHVAADGGLLGPAEEYIRFLQMLLNEGQLGNTRLLSAESVRQMTSNQIGALTVESQVGSTGTASPFPAGANRDKFGLGFQIKVGEEKHRRAPGSFSWSGVFNTHFWGDPHTGIAAVFFTQLLPFYDEQVMAVFNDFERCVYRNLP